MKYTDIKEHKYYISLKKKTVTAHWTPMDVKKASTPYLESSLEEKIKHLSCLLCLKCILRF